MIGGVVTDNQHEWDEILSYVMAAYRSAIHDLTGHSPNFLMFGREVRAPVDVVLGTPPSDEPATADAYADELYQRLVTAYQFFSRAVGAGRWSPCGVNNTTIYGSAQSLTVKDNRSGSITLDAVSDDHLNGNVDILDHMWLRKHSVMCFIGFGAARRPNQ